ncbi:hypothetical protein AC578_5898 [Pseudocercospora eumusae]|uniref:Ig-like domain-containing protein n=1 Tax=Pseudocercospora eumusae TaxID=321146 RepID=A0A139HBE6_9PEZI|nr:hypothetical protein AC578_5898 [Pseudocercospora eumusae]
MPLRTIVVYCRDCIGRRLIDLIWLLHFCLLADQAQSAASASTSASASACRYLDSIAHLGVHAIALYCRSASPAQSGKRSSNARPHSRPRSRSRPGLDRYNYHYHYRRAQRNPQTFYSLARFLVPRLLLRILLPCLLLYAACRGWHRNTLPAVPTHSSAQEMWTATCSRVCTTSSPLTPPGPAHPHVLRLSPKTPDFAPDWLLNSLIQSGDCITSPPPITVFADPHLADILAEDLALEASRFVRPRGVVVPLALHRDAVMQVPSLRTNELLPELLSAFTSWNAAAPRLSNKDVFRSAMAWSTNDTMFDLLNQQYSRVSSIIDRLRSAIIKNVEYIDTRTKQGRGWLGRPCVGYEACVNAYRHEIKRLRHLSAWADFVHLNTYVTWHMVDALAFFTRALLKTLDDEDVGFETAAHQIKQVYSKQRLHGIGNRAGLYAARNWAFRYENTSTESTSLCSQCLSAADPSSTLFNSSIWEMWWKPDSANLNVGSCDLREPQNPIMMQTRRDGLASRRDGGMPIKLPTDWRRWKSGLLDERCLGIDHLWTDELDEELGQHIQEPRDDHEQYLLGRMMLGPLWCVREPEVLALQGQASRAWESPPDHYWLRWVKEWEKRWKRKHHVDAAWEDQ